MTDRAMNGINLGGWLVIEKWMTPSLFKDIEATNEFELSGTKQGRARIKKHHASFITENDLKWLKEQGIEILRVPIGYWIFGDDKRYEPAIERLDWLVATSLSYGLKVLLDLHAAPEAQNRSAHSGSGNTVSDNYSTKWLNNISAQEKTIEVLCRLAERYRDSPSVWGIELLNEPSIDLTGYKLRRFYRNAYRRIVVVARPGTRIVFSDAYAPLRTNNCLWRVRKKDFPTVMDCHIYQVFGVRSKKRTFNQSIKRLKYIRRFLKFLRWWQPVVIGEWSAMLPVATSPMQTRRYVEMQTAVFEDHEAWFFWNYKTQAPGRWNYRDLVLGRGDTINPE